MIYYIILINLISAGVCALDKLRAIKKSRRISEKALFTLSFLGGAVGMYLTMLLVRHKTLHLRFMIGLPLIILTELIIFIFLLDRGIIML